MHTRKCLTIFLATAMAAFSCLAAQKLSAQEKEELDIVDQDGRRVQVGDLIDAGLLEVGSALIWERPRLGKSYTATVGQNGELTLEDGRSFSSPSRAAIQAADITAYDGWRAWRTEADRPISDLRAELLEAMQRQQEAGTGNTD